MQLVEQIVRMYATDNNEERQRLMDHLGALGKSSSEKQSVSIRLD